MVDQWTTTEVRRLSTQQAVDVAAMLNHYRLCTQWVAQDTDRTAEARRANPDHVSGLERQRATAAEIIRALGLTVNYPEDTVPS